MKKDQEQNNDDIVFESEMDDSVTAFDADKKLKKAKEALKKCQKEKTEYLDGWQRAKADFVNFKKRNDENLKDFRKYANESLILDLLPTIDNFEAALKTNPTTPEASQDEINISKWKTGFEHIYTQLKKTLENVGVQQLNPLGENFDPNLHEAVEELTTEDKKLDHKVAEVVMKGYKLENKILRAPQVKVWVLK